MKPSENKPAHNHLWRPIPRFFWGCFELPRAQQVSKRNHATLFTTTSARPYRRFCGGWRFVGDRR